MTTFTKHQINAWKVYESVRKRGKYNMFDPRARRLTGLTKEDYTFVMRNFSALKAAAQSEAA